MSFSAHYNMLPNRDSDVVSQVPVSLGRARFNRILKLSHSGCNSGTVTALKKFHSFWVRSTSAVSKQFQNSRTYEFSF